MTCGEGKQEERRSCDGGSGCEGSSNRTVLVCNAVPCPTGIPTFISHNYNYFEETKLIKFYYL